MDIIKKYWWCFLLILVIIPIGINFILLIPSITPIIGDNKVWLTFWGSFLGSAIMAVITLYVLQEQLSQNQKENEQNRKNNIKENISNRNLQLKIFLHQQEQIWLDKFRLAAAHYIDIYSYNDLVDVANIARKDPCKAFYMIKALISRSGKADLEMSFIQRMSEDFCKLNNDKTKFFIFYNDVLGDIQSLLTIRIDNDNITLAEGVPNLSDITDDMRKIISQILKEMPDDNIVNQFNTAIITRIKLVKQIEEKMRDCFCDYIIKEQVRIDNILKNDNGS